MTRGLIVNVVNLLHLLQMGFAFALSNGDPLMRDMCDTVFSALVSRDMRQSHVEIMADPCERYIRVIMRVVGTGDEEWLRKII